MASPLGGVAAIYVTPSGLFMSAALGFAGGVLMGTIMFELLPSALEFGSLALAIAGFLTGFAALYGLDLFVYRGALAGEKAEQFPAVTRHHRRHRPRGDEVTVLAAGTSAEELIEGLSIGVGFAVKPGLGLLVAAAIVIDNLSEALSIGELIRSGEKRKDGGRGRILKWTGLIGLSVLTSALLGWFFLRGLPPSALGFLLAAGGGGMFYLTVTDLVPQAQERQYQQIPAIAMAAGVMIIFAISQVV